MADLINEWAELTFNEVNQERKKLNYFLIFDRLQIHKVIFIYCNFCDWIRNTYTMKSLHLNLLLLDTPLSGQYQPVELFSGTY